MKHFSLIQTAFFLKNTPLFEDLELDLLFAIADKVHQDIYQENEKIFSVDDRASKIYFVGKGCISLYDEKDRLLTDILEENFFGEEALFNNQPRAYHCQAKEVSLILSIAKSHFMTILQECPSVALTLLETYSEKIPNRHVKEK